MADQASVSSVPPSYPPAFMRAVGRVLADEGGYANQRADPGGATRFGISQRQYPRLDVRSLGRDQAVAIYFRDFWSRGRYGELPAPIAEKVFDLAVNMGPSPAARCMQRALRACGRRLADDGVVGDLTLAAARAADERALLAGIRSEAAGHYRMVAALWPGGRAVAERDFLNGWLNRAYE